MRESYESLVVLDRNEASTSNMSEQRENNVSPLAIQAKGFNGFKNNIKSKNMKS